MPILNKTKNTAAIFNRGREVVKVYDHGKLTWQKSIPDYLCFTALEQGRFTLSVSSYVTTTYLSYIEWSKDGRNWNRTTNENNGMTINVDVVQGDKVYWRGSGVTMTSLSAGADRGSIFSSTANFDASGHIMSLLQGGDFNDDALVNYSTSGIRNVTFARIFEDCEKLINAQDLVLPKFSSWYTYIFYQAFHNCTGLVTAPQLPTIEMSQSCFFGMFNGCTSLLEASDILATTAASECCRGMYVGCTSLTNTGNIAFTTLAANCCRQMFYGCSSITSSSLLISATLAENSYYAMFYNCSSLSYVKCLATDISANGCLTNWLYNVSSTGTFIQAEGVEWPRGASGIPTGWVDVEKRTMPSGYKQVEYLQAVKPYPSNYNAAIIGTGIVLDPSQDTIELAIRPRFDENGYLINGSGSTAGEMPFANSSSPSGNNIKVGTFYVLYRVNSSTNRLQCTYTIENGDSDVKAVVKTVFPSQGVTDNPQTIRIEFSATSAVMLLNGTQVSSASGYTIDTSDMTTTQAFVLSYNNSTYNWEHPFYYLKWWRSGSMIADYVPCVRESDDEVGFYDFVSQTFKTRYYTNSNALIAGEVV